MRNTPKVYLVRAGDMVKTRTTYWRTTVPSSALQKFRHSNGLKTMTQ